MITALPPIRFEALAVQPVEGGYDRETRGCVSAGEGEENKPAN